MVAAERHAVVVDGVEVVERDDLEPAGVGEDRPVPAHEAVEAPEPLDPLVAGPQVEVVRVGQDDLRPDLVEVVRMERLHRRVRADRHEHRRLHAPVGQVEAPHPGPGGAVRGRWDENVEAGGAHHGRGQASGFAGGVVGCGRSVARGRSIVDSDGGLPQRRLPIRPARRHVVAERGEVGPRPVRRDAALRRPVEEADPEEVRLVDVLDGLDLLGEDGRQRGDPDGPAAELLDDRGQQPPVGRVEALAVDLEDAHRLVDRRRVDAPVAVHLGVVADPAEEPVHDPRRGPAPGRDGDGRLVGDLDPEDPGRAADDRPEVLLSVEVEAVDGPEPVAERPADPAGPRRRPDDRERPQRRGAASVPTGPCRS